MRDGETIYLAWNDYVGLTRCRGVPPSEISKRMAHGLGWAVAGQALTPFEDIADNPWGPMLEVRQVPVPETETRIDLWDGIPPFHIFLCDSKVGEENWECCTRGFMKSALADFERETGLQFAASFEHEFTLAGPGVSYATPFSLEAIRNAAAFTGAVTKALTIANVGLETVEPEYGVNQIEISCGPAVGAAAGDRALITREVIRETARRMGLRASFTPKPTPDAVGNGAHVHFSFVAKDGSNASYEAGGIGDASQLAQHFIAGVVRHMPALCALVAPSPVSYLRLGPHHWSCGYASFGIQNREAAVRICPSPAAAPTAKASGFNMEIRAPDGTASPYLVIGGLVRAGLEGIRDKLALPQAVDRDPSDLSEDERKRIGIRPLPSSLREAIQVFEADMTASNWLPKTMRDSYLAVKRKEVDMFTASTPEAMCKRYFDAY